MTSTTNNNEDRDPLLPSDSRPNIQDEQRNAHSTAALKNDDNNNNQASNTAPINYYNPKPTIHDLHQMEKEDELTRKPNIEDASNFLSSWTFSWFNKIMNDACDGKLRRGEILPTSMENCTTKLTREVEDELFFKELEKEKTWDDFFASTNGGAVPPVHPYVGVKMVDDKNAEKDKNGNPITRRGVILWIGKLLQDEPDHSVSKFSLGPSKMRAAVQWFDQNPNTNSKNNRNNNHSPHTPLLVKEEYLEKDTPPILIVSEDGTVNGEDLVGMLPALPHHHRKNEDPIISCIAVEELEIDFTFKPPQDPNNQTNPQANVQKKCSKQERDDIYARRQSSSGYIGGGKDDVTTNNNNNSNQKKTPSTSTSASSYPVPSRASMIYTIARPHISDFMWKVIPLRLLAEASNLAAPYLLELYVDYLHKDANDHPGLWKDGVVISSALAVVYFIFSITSQKWFQIAMRAGLKIRSALMLTILHKALCLSPQAQAHPALSIGKCVTLFGTDVARVGDSAGYIVYIVSMPVQLGVTIFLLYRLMGWVAFVSLGVTLLFIPATAIFMKKNADQRAKMSAATDQRAKLTTELFSSFKVIKCMGWEGSFLRRLLEIRDTELDFLGEMQKYRVATSFLMNAAPAVVLAVSLITFHVTGNKLTPVVIFPVISLLSILRMFSMILPWMFQIFVDVNVSLGRMRTFLSADDLAPFISMENENNNNNEQSSNNNKSHQHQPPRDGIVVADLNVSCFETKDITKELKKGYGRKLKLWNLEQREQRCCCTSTTCCCFAKPGDGNFLKEGVFEENEQEEEEKKRQEAEKQKADEKSGKKTDEANAVKKRIENTSKTIEAIAQKRILSEVSIKIPKSGLCVITGETGSGKSVLMESLLSFTHATFAKTDTPVAANPLIRFYLDAKNNNNDDSNTTASTTSTKITPKIAYFPQQPWLMNGTVKENVIFFDKAPPPGQQLMNKAELENDDNEVEYTIDEDRFQKAITSCELLADINSFPKHEKTMVGSSNLVVSGGQRARIALARCVYSDADFYFLDDPLSALDAHVGENVFKKCICGTLKNKTRILVTHHVHYLHYANHIIHLEAGRVAFQGDYAEYTAYVTDKKQQAMKGAGPDDSALSRMNSTVTPLTKLTSTSFSNNKPQFPTEQQAPAAKSSNLDDETSGKVLDETADGETKKDGEDDDDINSKSPTSPDSKKKSGEKNDDEEEMEEGDIKKETWLSYFHAAGGMTRVVLITIWFIITECMNQSQVIWLTFWSGDIFHFENNSTYLYIYVGLVGSGFISSASRSWLILETGRYASRYLHFKILTSMIVAKVQFFDTRPLGTVINRFSADINSIDMQIPMDVQSLLAIVLSLISTLVIMVSSQPIVIVALIIIWYAYFKVMKFFNASVRSIKRIDSVNKSPIFALVTEFMEGTKTILAFNKAAPLLRRASRRIDAYFSTSYCLQLVNRWLGVRLELLGNATIASIAFAGVITKSFPSHTSALGNSQNALVGLIALGLTLSMQIVGLMNYLVRMVAAVNADFNAVERIDQYSNETELESEIINKKMIPKHYQETFEFLTEERVEFQKKVQATIKEKVQEIIKNNPKQKEEDDANSVAPQLVEDDKEYNDRISKHYEENNTRGISIVLEKVSMRYRPELPLVLKNVSFVIPRGSKVALVGRSGAAKSSLMGVFMRLTGIDHGHMLIEGKDSVKDLSLSALRENFALVSQDPTMFQGTVRSNLDPFNFVTDQEIEKAIDMVGMTERIFYPSSAHAAGGNGEDKDTAQIVSDDDSSDEKGQEDFVVDDNTSPTDFTPKNNPGSKPSSPTLASPKVRLPLKEALEQTVSSNNFSAGQQQLLCLCRCLLRKSAKCILLDEASSSIDQASDELIQKTIRSAFADRTCVFVAHRLTTIAHVDKVIVMDKGRVAEIGSPRELMKKTEDGKFYSLVSSGGKKGLKQFERALEKYGSKI